MRTNRRQRVRLAGALIAVGLAAVPGRGEPPPEPQASARKRDVAATRFLNTCNGCHSLSGVKLAGPDLSHVAGWPMDQLKTAIKRMEKSVGPLGDADVAALAELLQAPDVRERLKVEEARIQAQFVAQLEPPDAAVGRQLFLGQTPLKNGGLACAACHTVAGQGGNLGPDLTGVHARLGNTPLISAIEKASFKVMAPHYRWHPVTRQEALHLTQYLATLDSQSVSPARQMSLPLGAGGALAAFAGLALYFRSARADRGPKLQRRSR